METKGVYIYGIVPNFYGAELFRSLKKMGVNFISYENISAIVSQGEITCHDFSDRESLARLLIHHQKTIEDVMAIGFNIILPLKLGTIVPAKEEVLRILSKGHDLIMTTLKKIEFLTEIDIVVTWADFGGVLNEIAKHPDIIEIKDELLKNIDNLSHVDQMKVGMMIQDKLNEKNKQVELNILNALGSFSIDVKKHEVMNDQMILNSAFLINRNAQAEFEKVIDQIDEEYMDLLNFKLVGPLPCYSFNTIEVQELNLEHVELARKELGLREERSKYEIKKAYQEKIKLFHPDTHSTDGDAASFDKINKAYQTMLDFSEVESQPLSENLILVKIKT